MMQWSRICQPMQELKRYGLRRVPEMASHSSILPWKIPWTEEPEALHFMGSESDTIEHKYTQVLLTYTYKFNNETKWTNLLEMQFTKTDA